MALLEELDNVVIQPTEYKGPKKQQKAPILKLTLTHWLLVLIALLSLLFIAFITLAKSVQITSYTLDVENPDNALLQQAEVSIDALLQLPIGNRVMLLPGDYPVLIEAKGHHPYADTLNVLNERYQQFDINLTPLPGLLDIVLVPEIQATVSIGETLIGELPGLIEQVPVGAQLISVDAPLYRKKTQPLVIQGKGITQSLSIELEPAWAELGLSSKPVGATIVVDGQQRGITPTSLKLEEGSREIELRADGFKPYKSDVIIVAQQDLIVADIELKPADAVLEVSTSPNAAAVILNNEFVGVSPMTLNLAPDEGHKLRVYKAGYQLHDTQINLQADQRDIVNVELQADLVPVKFSVVPSDAEIIVDGQSRGKGTQTLYLSTLQHSINIRKQGYASYQSTIIPTRSNEQLVSVKLLTAQEKFWVDVPPKYNSPVGQTMILFTPPGEVSIGSSRGEAGRRENEVQYKARLSKHFYVSEKEVTNKEFRQYNSAHNSGNYKGKSLDSSQLPVVNVSWQEAALYCNWLSTKEGLQPFYQIQSGYVSGQNPQANGYRLLTEVEWAWLSRNKGNNTLVYPWGNNAEFDRTQQVGNFADDNAKELIAFTLEGYDDGYTGTAPVGRYKPNHNGLYDLEGNASEWINDWYSARGNLESSNSGQLVDPLGPEIGEFHVIRGASWAKGYLPQLRFAYRDFGAKGKHDVGFRVARYVVPPS